MRTGPKKTLPVRAGVPRDGAFRASRAGGFLRRQSSSAGSSTKTGISRSVFFW